MTTPDRPDANDLTEVEVKSIGEKQAAIATEKRDRAWFGWKPDLPDHNDARFAIARITDMAPTPQPATTNFLGHVKIPIYDQLELGSCTANAALRAYRIMIRRTIGGLHDFDGSRLAHYFWTRELAGDPTSEDTGATIRDAMKVFAKVGVTPETLWPYLVREFDRAPSAVALAKAAARLRVTYRRVPQDANTIRATIVKRHPIVFGMSVFGSTADALEGDGQIPHPKFNEAVIGGHALVIEDYDDVSFDEPVVVGAGSWGVDVGLGTAPERLPARYRNDFDTNLLRGYFALPMSMLVNADICDDLWTIDAAA